MTRLTPDQERQVLKLLAEKHDLKRIAAEFSVSQNAIHRLKNRPNRQGPSDHGHIGKRS